MGFGYRRNASGVVVAAVNVGGRFAIVPFVRHGTPIGTTAGLLAGWRKFLQPAPVV